MSEALQERIDWDQAKQRIAHSREALRSALSNDAKDANERLRTRAKALAARGVATTESGIPNPMLVFGLGDGRYALPLTALSGVGSWQSPSYMPAAHEALIGMFAVRSAVWAMYELALLIGVGPPVAAAEGNVLFLKNSTRSVALRVDHLEGVELVRDADIREAPKELRQGDVPAVGFWQDGVIVMDGERLLRHPAITGEGSL